MKIITGIIALALFSGCTYLNDQHYNDVVNVDSNVKRLQANDQKLEQEIRSLKASLGLMNVSMEKEVEAETVAIEQISNESIQVTMQQEMLFKSGSSKISTTGRALLKHFAEGIRTAPESARVRIVGHTDSYPVGSELRAKYTDNWELSAARAAAVARALIWGENISQNRFHIEASGAIAPVADNTSEEGRAKNRRIELYLEDI
ncbi:MAG: OmpA family protein [Mariprofundaceae bacterium]